MKTRIIKIGNSRGIIIPKAVIDQCGISDQVAIEVENKKITITPVEDDPREGWEEAILAVGGMEDDELLIGDYLEHSWDEEEWQW